MAVKTRTVSASIHPRYSCSDTTHSPSSICERAAAVHVSLSLCFSAFRDRKLVIIHPILRPSYPPPHSTSSVCERMTAVSLHFMRVISYPIDRSSYPPSSYPPSLTSHQPSSPPPPMRTWETKTAIVAAAVVHRWLHADGPPVDKQIHRSRSDAGWSRPWCSHAALRRRHLAW